MLTVDGLQERNAGQWSGLTHDEIDERWPGWIEGGQRPDGWEPDTELHERVLTALNRIATDHAGATVLVVCHGGVIISLEKHLGVFKNRIPNLHGRVVVSEKGELRALESIQLIPQSISTGGTSNRV